jgi:hypothetical protein
LCITGVVDFHKEAEKFITIMSNLSDQVEIEKMRSIGIRNLLHSVTKEYDAEKQQLEVYKQLSIN